MNQSPLVVEYFTDVLCVWAWIAQRRVEELESHFGAQIDIKHQFVDIFGDVPSKMESQWQSKGGYSGFAGHVLHAAERFENAPVNPKVWSTVRPQTSANAHLVSKAIGLAYDADTAADSTLWFRKAFFEEALDIGSLDVLCDVVTFHGLEPDVIQTRVHDGSAMAALMGDYQRARQQQIKGSPSVVIDDGRQALYGNVGYRVIEANIEELLKQPEDEASWC